jgi:hypothetical protein
MEVKRENEERLQERLIQMVESRLLIGCDQKSFNTKTKLPPCKYSSLYTLTNLKYIQILTSAVL